MACGSLAWCWCPGCAPHATLHGLGCRSAAMVINVPNWSISVRDQEMGPFVASLLEPPATASSCLRLGSHTGSVVRAPTTTSTSTVLSAPGHGSPPAHPSCLSCAHSSEVFLGPKGLET